jgi:hypothetical protein
VLQDRITVGRPSSKDVHSTWHRFPANCHELLQVNQLGIDVCAISKSSVGQWKGYGVFIFVREADGWKSRSEYDGTLIE